MVFCVRQVIDDMRIGGSLYDAEGAKIVGEIMAKAAANGVTIHLPDDFVAGNTCDL